MLEYLYTSMDNEKSEIYNKPLIIREFFDDNSYKEILSYMDTGLNYIPHLQDNNEFVRKFIHNPSFFVNIHYQLKDIASDFFKEKVKPSYCFLSMYENNGICPLHIDRDQCRYTIDYLIRTTQKDPWPIHIGKHMTDSERMRLIIDNNCHPQTDEEIEDRISKEEFETVELMPNDAVLYSGTHQWHYRSQRLNGTADLIFFHFVPEDFNGPLE